MKHVIILASLLTGCTDAWERRQHPCGFEDGQWVYHKLLRENVIIDRVVGDGDQFWTRTGEHFPLKCADVEPAH